jgi:hypothetical protein
MYYEIRSLDASKAIISQYLPRMGFNISSMVYDGTRKLNNSISYDTEQGNLSFTGVPYDFTFDLSILCKNQDDLYQILEQIAVLFTPDKSVTVKEIPEIGLERDISITLDSISFSSVYEFEDAGNRTVGADLSFTLKGHLYPAVKDVDTNIIETIFVNYKAIKGNTPTNEEKTTDYGIKVRLEQVENEIIKTLTEDI